MERLVWGGARRAHPQEQEGGQGARGRGEGCLLNALLFFGDVGSKASGREQGHRVTGGGGATKQRVDQGDAVSTSVSLRLPQGLE